MKKNSLLAFSAIALIFSPALANDLHINRMPHADGGGIGHSVLNQIQTIQGPSNFGGHGGGVGQVPQVRPTVMPPVVQRPVVMPPVNVRQPATPTNVSNWIRNNQTRGQLGGKTASVQPQINPGIRNGHVVGTGSADKMANPKPQILPVTAGPGGNSVLTGATGVGAPMTSALPPVVVKNNPNAPQVYPGRPTTPGSPGDIGGSAVGTSGEGSVLVQGNSGGPGGEVICVFNCGPGGEGQPMQVGGIADRRLGEQMHAH